MDCFNPFGFLSALLFRIYIFYRLEAELFKNIGCRVFYLILEVIRGTDSDYFVYIVVDSHNAGGKLLRNRQESSEMINGVGISEPRNLSCFRYEFY